MKSLSLRIAEKCKGCLEQCGFSRFGLVFIYPFLRVQLAPEGCMDIKFPNMVNFGPHTLRHVVPHMPCHIKLYPPILTVRFLKILMSGWHSNLFKNSELIHWFTSLSTKIAQPRHNYLLPYCI